MILRLSVLVALLGAMVTPLAFPATSWSWINYLLDYGAAATEASLNECNLRQDASGSATSASDGRADIENKLFRQFAATYKSKTGGKIVPQAARDEGGKCVAPQVEKGAFGFTYS